MLPTHIEQLKGKAMKSFQGFLAARGSQILLPTNEYEVLRFTGPDGCTCILYRNKAGYLRWNGRVIDAYEAFKTGGKWSATVKIFRTKNGKKKLAIKQSIKDRDGGGCFYCTKELPLDQMTIEHFVPVNAGGPDHISNMALSCCGCNREAGHMPVVKKMHLAMTKRKAA